MNASHHFKLTHAIEDVPAGTIGQLKRLDDDHLALFFDNRYPDLVLDINDTEPEVLAAITHTRNPSMVDPPRRWVAAAIVVAFLRWVGSRRTPDHPNR
jgi:hypothetical protein